MKKNENDKTMHVILRKIRDEIIQSLTANRVNHITSYNISSTRLDKTFEITFKESNKNLQGRIVEVLERNFGEDLKYGKSSNGKKVIITVTNSYIESFLQEISEKDKKALKEQNDEGATRGRKKTEFGNFRDAVVAHIESITKLKCGGKRSFYVLASTNERGTKSIDIRCADFSTVIRILSALERKEDYLARVVSYDKKKIVMSELPVSGEVIKVRKNLLSYVERIENESNGIKHAFGVVRNSSVIVAASNLEDVNFEFLTKDFDSSLRLSQLINQDFKILKQGKLLRVSGTYDQFVNEVSRKILIGCSNAVSVEKGKSENGLSKKGSTTSLSSKRGKGLVFTETSGGTNAYVRVSTNYNDFNFLYFNRKVETRHVSEIVESVKRHGIISFVTVVITDCIDGTKQMYIVDGQHRFEAFRSLGLPILYTVVEASDKKEIVRLIADLNKTSRRWSTRNFMEAWSSLKIDDYTQINTALTETKLPITLILEIFSEKDRSFATKMFQDGDFEIINTQKNMAILRDINSLKNELPRSRELFSCVAVAMRKIKNYSVTKIAKVLTSNKIVKLRESSPGREKMISEIVNEYNRIAA